MGGPTTATPASLSICMPA